MWYTSEKCTELSDLGKIHGVYWHNGGNSEH